VWTTFSLSIFSSIILPPLQPRSFFNVLGSLHFRPYTYVDKVGDVNLDTFSLQEEDTVYKIPYVEKAISLRATPIKMYASPWSAPAWMKSNNDLIGQGFLLPEYYQAWANYFVKFLDAYKDLGIEFWGLTAQNEPWDGTVANFSFNSMGWNSSTQREWIVNNLGPTLEAGGYADVKLMILDDQRPLVPKWAREVFQDERALKYVSGIGIHWYVDDFFPFPSALDQAHEEFPDKFLLYTEACNGDRPWDTEKVQLGDWDRGERYLHNILEDLNHWVVGWTDWNLALDMEGGPNWAENRVDAPIIVDPETDGGVFYKQPMYYALGHVSRFLSPGSVRVDLDTGLNPVEAVAFKRPDFNGWSSVGVVFLNRFDNHSEIIVF
jgi:glucosylceramidase